MPKKYIPVSQRSPASVEKYNERMRLRRMKARIASGKVPVPKKFTPGAAELIESAGLADSVIVPRLGDEHLLAKVRKVRNESKRRKWNNVKFKGDGNG